MSPTLYEILFKLSEDRKFRVNINDVLIVGIEAIKQLETLHTCGIALNNVGLNNLCFSKQQKTMMFCDFSQISAFDPSLESIATFNQRRTAD